MNVRGTEREFARTLPDAGSTRRLGTPVASAWPSPVELRGPVHAVRTAPERGPAVVLGRLGAGCDDLPHLDPLRRLRECELHGCVASPIVAGLLGGNEFDVPAAALYDTDETASRCRHRAKSYPSTSMPFFESDGVRLHYIISGPEDGQPTVFV